MEESKYYSLKKKRGIIYSVIAVAAFLYGIRDLITTSGAVISAIFALIGFVEIKVYSKKIEAVVLSIWILISNSVLVYLNTYILRNHNSFQKIQYILMGMLVLFIIELALSVITGNIRLSVAITSVLAVILLIVNFWIYEFRGSEIRVSDVLVFKTAFNVADNYKYQLSGEAVLTILCAISIITFGYSIKYIDEATKTDEDKNEKKKRFYWKKHLAYLVVDVIAVIMFILFSKNMSVEMFGTRGSTIKTLYLNEALQVKNLITGTKVDYSVEDVNKLADKYSDDKYAIESVVVDKDEEKPIIIAIMNESFSDLSVYGDKLKTSEEVMPFFNSLEENTIKGYALSSVYGGGTCNSEYEFLTGNSMWFYRDSVGYPFERVLNGNNYSLFSILRQGYGYSSMFTHNFDGENYRRYIVYPDAFNVDEFYDWDYYDKKGEYKPDKVIYDFIINRYEKQIEEKEDEPLFIMAVTFQNHGPYIDDNISESNIKIVGGVSREYSDATEYLSRIKDSDNALKDLIEYFSNQDRKVIVVMYGDHQPSLDGRFYEDIYGGKQETLDEQMISYMVPFMVWANYDIEEKYVECTSLNYLSNYVLAAAGYDAGYNRFLNDMEQIIPSMNAMGYYSKTKGKYIPYEEATGEEKDYLDDYADLQYNNSYDMGHANTFFFPTP